MSIHRIFVVHGASGAGKSMLLQMLERINPSLTLHIKDSDSAPRPGETPPVSGDIRFMAREDIERNADAYEVIHYRYENVYGIHANQLLEAFRKKQMHFIVMSDIGAIRKLKERYDAKAIHIHVDPDHLPEAIRARDGVDWEERARRIDVHRKEYVENSTLFDHVVLNYWRNADEAIRQLENIILHYRRLATNYW